MLRTLLIYSDCIHILVRIFNLQNGMDKEDKIRLFEMDSSRSNDKDSKNEVSVSNSRYGYGMYNMAHIQAFFAELHVSV